MIFEPKMSGTCVKSFSIIPLFTSQLVWLSEIMEKVQNQLTINFILDTFKFHKGEEKKAHDWWAILDYDTILKISIMENYPEYERELIDYFGEDWFKHYIRFNH